MAARLTKVSTARADLEYIEDGDRTGDPLVLVHGFPDGPETWDAVLDLLPANLWTIRPSLRGTGDSRARAGARSGQVAALACDVLELMDALQVQAAVLVGHDWGARAAHAVAVLQAERVRGLVTLATAYGPRTTLTAEQSLDDAAASWYRYWLCTQAGAASFRQDPTALIQYAWDHWTDGGAIPASSRPALLDRFHNPDFVDTVIHYYRHGADEAEGNPAYQHEQERLDAWPAIEVPTSFLIGTADRNETTAAARAAAPSFSAGFTLRELDGIGHFVQREAPEPVAAAIRAHLARST